MRRQNQLLLELLSANSDHELFRISIAYWSPNLQLLACVWSSRMVTQECPVHVLFPIERIPPLSHFEVVWLTMERHSNLNIFIFFWKSGVCGNFIFNDLICLISWGAREKICHSFIRNRRRIGTPQVGNLEPTLSFGKSSMKILWKIAECQYGFLDCSTEWIEIPFTH